MSYEEWEANVPAAIKSGPVWRFYGYRKALFLYDLVWEDCQWWLKDKRGKAIVEQIIRSAGSIAANIEEGYGRGFGKQYAYFLGVALGSARETKGWYYRGRHLLPKGLLEHRLALLEEVISLLVTEKKHQKSMIRDL